MAEIISLLKDSFEAAEQLRDIIGNTIEDKVEIVLTDRGHMKVLNRRYRHMNRPTDVLSFDLSDSPEERPAGTIFVDGRLYPPMEELLERVCHGYLHLVGYRHDTKEENLEMNEKVEEMVSRTLKKLENGKC